MKEDELTRSQGLHNFEGATLQPTQLREDKVQASSVSGNTTATSTHGERSTGTEHAVQKQGLHTASEYPRQVKQVPSDMEVELEAGPLERLNLLTLLKDMTNRLGALEAALSKPTNSEGKSRGQFLLELFKTLLGGWPAFGFIFLIMFYFPLRDALRAIPDRVKSADEIQLPGVSLKSTIKKVADSQGLAGLGETIPKLSSPAIELLLRAPRHEESLVSFTNADDRTHFTAINFPSESVIKSLKELQEKGLIKLEGGLGESKPLDGIKLDQLLSKVKEKFIGFAESSSGDDRISWKLREPLAVDTSSPISLMWTLTDTGSQAVNVILKAVSTQLLQADDVKSK
jgi:hypothetical protein